MKSVSGVIQQLASLSFILRWFRLRVKGIGRQASRGASFKTLSNIFIGGLDGPLCHDRCHGDAQAFGSGPKHLPAGQRDWWRKVVDLNSHVFTDPNHIGAIEQSPFHCELALLNSWWIQVANIFSF